MALWFGLNINDTCIGYFEAVRIEGGDRPDDINAYRITLKFGPGEDDWIGEVIHRYGDGAWELVRKVLMAKRRDDHALEDDAHATNDAFDKLHGNYVYE